MASASSPPRPPPPISTGVNFVSAILEEISLEGLDGATLDAVVTRLRARPSAHAILAQEKERGDKEEDGDVPLRGLVWRSCRAHPQLRFYRLPAPRPKLVIFDRYKHLDSELGMVIEPETLPADPYPYGLVDRDGNKGSCATYDSRVDVTTEAR